MKFALKFSIVYSILFAVSSQLSGTSYVSYKWTGGGNYNYRPIGIQTTTQRYQNNFLYNYGEQNNQLRRSDYSYSLPSCESFWTLRSSYEGTWGELSILPIDVSNSTIRVILSLAARLPTNYVGDISLVKDKQSAINDVANGLPILHRIRFPLQNPLPKLKAIYHNDQLICDGQTAVGDYVTTITLDHTLYTNIAQHQQQQYQSVNSQNQNYNPTQPPYVQYTQPPPPTQPPYVHYTQPPPPTQPPYVQYTQPPPPPVVNRVPVPVQLQSSPENSYSSNKRLNELSSQCGVPNQRVQEITGLVINGKAAIKGQFPWLAAYYHSGYGDSGFICGGSLVSSKIVVTAAHCIQNKNEELIRKAEEALFHFGKHYIYSQMNERDAIISGVSQFMIHPAWNAYTESFDGDIALAILIRSLIFTNYIRPICLWTQTSNYYDVINAQGVVAGWGKTDKSASASDKPFYAKFPIVDESTCLRSNPSFSKFTSKKTFCAGSRDGTGPCSGDSGGGFVVKSGGKWYLRGVISSSLVNSDQQCDTTNYAVFSDVSSYKDWITQYIERYG